MLSHIARSLWRALAATVFAVVAVFSALVAVPGSAHAAAPICRVAITVTTGQDGLSDRTGVGFTLGGRQVLFEDADGDFAKDEAPSQPLHKGGTGDVPWASYQWDGGFEPCVPREALADGFDIINEPPVFNDWPDDWDLRGLRIVDRDTGTILVDQTFYNDDRNASVHRFPAHEASVLNTDDLPAAMPPGPTGNPDLVCRVAVTVMLSEDGIRNDLRELVRLGGRRLTFEDHNGDLVRDRDENRTTGHRGGTDDRRPATFVWEGAFEPCVPRAALAGGFEIEHIAGTGSSATDTPDNWSLRGVRIIDLDSGETYVDIDPYHGVRIHRFEQNTGQIFNTGSLVVPTGDTARWGYAYMDQATAPVGVATPLNGTQQWTTARLDPTTAHQRAAVTRTGTGAYRVRLPGVGSAAGIAHVTAYRTAYRGRTCAVAGQEPDGADELVSVRCFDHTGRPVDWWFTIFTTTPTGGGSPYATIDYDAPGGGTSQNPVLNPRTFNSAGGVARVVRSSPGLYQVAITGRPFAADTGHVQLTTSGSAPVRCAHTNTEAGSDALELTIACHSIGTSTPPQPADAPWRLSYVRDTGLHHTPGVPAAHVAVTGDPADPTIDPAHTSSTNGETPTLNRLSTGHYRLTWPSLGKPGDSAQITSTGTNGHYCHLGAINSYAAAPRLLIDVYCHNPAGTPADATFTLAYLRAP